MLRLIDADATIYADNALDDLLTWLRDNDQLGWEFVQRHRPAALVVDGHIHDSVRSSFDDQATAFFQTIADRFDARIALAIRWLDCDETQHLYFGRLSEVKAVHDTLSEILTSLSHTALLGSDTLGDLQHDLVRIHRDIQLLQIATKARLQDVWY